ncbi:F-box only protein 5 isoform X2 [Anguilla anguilla]|uniref:F-box only protein 5 isoform X2 n=1 Tax=Anguilla anguilla TaxID=7936 RepID=UPI0015AA83D0|nr:F-box only protein 5 isoform X2 [Anguilla anguilla]
MKSPFTKPEAPLICKMERCEKVLEQTSPKKTPASVALKPRPPACVKALTFDSHESPATRDKENREESLSSSLLGCGELEGEAAALALSSFQEDSGYASPDQTGGSSTPLAAAASLLRAGPADPKLPALLFQRAVCRALREGYERTRRFDWTVAHGLAGQFGLHNVIGGKMGLEHVDVLQGLLKRDMKHLLTRILLLLGDGDLVSCKKVSRTWRKIISGDPRAQRRCKEAEQRLWDSRQNGPLLTRDVNPSRSAFSHVQLLASIPIQKPSGQDQTSSRKSRFREFQEIGCTVRQDEGLKPCRVCGSPARFSPAACRAACTRRSCGFVCCTLCQAQYHGSSACRLGVSRNPGQSKPCLLVGSAQSKRNVRRL